MVQATVTARVARGWTCCCHECDWSGCARGRKTCMLGAGPPRDGIIRTSPGQECSKDKGALPGARRIFVYAARFWSTAGPASTVWFKPYRLVLHLDEKRVSLYPAKRRSARSSMDRASDYGSEGWGFESLRARSGPPRCDPPVGVLHFEKHSFGSAFSCPPRRRRDRFARRDRASRARRRHHPRLGRQGPQPLNPQGLRDIGGATRPGHAKRCPDKRHDVRRGPAQAS